MVNCMGTMLPTRPCYIPRTSNHLPPIAKTNYVPISTELVIIVFNISNAQMELFLDGSSNVQFKKD